MYKLERLGAVNSATKLATRDVNAIKTSNTLRGKLIGNHFLQKFFNIFIYNIILTLLINKPIFFFYNTFPKISEKREKENRMSQKY